ncbi:plant UBX domain-containing protein 4-like [Euphorbia lathyris]|uniref:plant UBX domain-containing protein 4-like n=1 Tax=Euphorbia lathyris TaxID=212925 RepID=UPI003314428E
MDNPTADYNAALINSFCEITSSSKQEALFFLESHQWNLDSAVSTFLDSDNTSIDIPPASLPIAHSSSPEEESQSPNYSPSLSHSPSRSRSPSPAPSRPSYRLRSRGKKPAKPSASGSRTRGGVRTLADLNRKTDVGSGSDDDDDDDFEPQQYYTGGEKSGMLVQDPSKGYDAEGVFNQARNSGAVERPADNPRSSSSSRSFAGTGRLLSGETVPSAPQPPEVIEHTVTLWRNGFTVDDGPLRRFDDPANASFLESIKNSECPLELEPADRRTQVHLDLMRREENYSEPEKSQASFQGVGRTLGSSTDAMTPAPDPSPTTASLRTAALPAMGLVVDSSSPTTSLQLRLADGTRMVSRFNLHHTIGDLCAFIDASRPGGARNYQLQTMGFPPKQLSDPEQTIEQAGIANSVVIQKF